MMKSTSSAASANATTSSSPLTGKNKPQKVGNMTVELKGVNEKSSQFSVDLTAEDRQLRKEEPRHERAHLLLHFTARRFLEEMVINKVGKDTISGYVSIPKANAAPAATTSTSGN